MALAGVVVIVLAVLLVVALAVTFGGARSAKSGDSAHGSAVAGPTVEYRVPRGQDPVAVVSRLRQAGYDARPSEPASQPTPPTQPTVVVVCPRDERDELRRAIATAPMSSVEDPHGGVVQWHEVHFTDE